MNDRPDCCRTCQFIRAGECHRNPPFLIIIGSKYDPVWPRVNSSNWCGEYKPMDVVEIDSGRAQYYPLTAKIK